MTCFVRGFLRRRIGGVAQQSGFNFMERVATTADYWAHGTYTQLLARKSRVKSSTDSVAVAGGSLGESKSIISWMRAHGNGTPEVLLGRAHFV